MAARAANELTALQALQRIEAGSLTSEALIEACLQRIACGGSPTRRTVQAISTGHY